jgi:outer membrane protein assembly factor BamE
MRILLALLLAAVTTACGLLYRPVVQQGVPLTAEQLAGLRPGLSKRQVQLLLGSPPVTDSFHPDRWDYVYTIGEAGKVPAPEKRLTLHFRNDALVRAEGELAPAALTGADNGSGTNRNGGDANNGAPSR